MRTVLLRVVAEREGSHTLQSGGVINEAARRLKIVRSLEDEQALLTFWSDLFRSGYLAWGYDLSNIDAPFCHITDRGRRVLANLSRDPANPGGYLKHLAGRATLNPIAASYLREALETFNAGSFKSAAVMLGAASESLVLALRDQLVAKMGALGQPASQKLSDWRLKTILDALEEALKQKKKSMPNKLFESFESYWPAFTQQIRAVRNEAGHPTSVDPIDEPTVHAALLIFPEIAYVASQLEAWIISSYT